MDVPEPEPNSEKMDKGFHCPSARCWRVYRIQSGGRARLSVFGQERTVFFVRGFGLSLNLGLSLCGKYRVEKFYTLLDMDMDMDMVFV